MNVTDLKSEVTQLIAEIDRTHRYSMSVIYELSNKVFNSNEAPQSCASCLIRKVRQLRKWLEEQNALKTKSELQESAIVKKQRKNRQKKKDL